MHDILTIAKLLIVIGVALMILSAMLGRPRKPPKHTIYTKPPYRPPYRPPNVGPNYTPDPAAFVRRRPLPHAKRRDDTG